MAVNFGAASFRLREMRANARFRPNESGVPLEITLLVVGHLEERKSPTDLVRIQYLMRDSELPRGGECVLEKILDMSA